jgi:putative hydrolase of the HAD superfamily
MRFEAVFFDAGETLVHPQPTFPDLFAQILTREGYDVDAQTVRDRMHVVFDRFKQAADTNELWTTSRESSRKFWRDVYEIFFADLGIADPDLIDTVYREFTNPANYTMFDDVLPVLETLAGAGLKLGVVSNFEVWLGRLMDDLGLTPFFAVRVISAVEGLEKPDPRIFRLAMDRAGVAPEVSVYVGDDPVFDIEPAEALGMFPVLIDRRERFPSADGARIVSMKELPNLLDL